jgi:hypothetical protein
VEIDAEHLGKLCGRILEDICKNPSAKGFLEPVDWKTLELWDYPEVVQNPMDLGTIRKRLQEGYYQNLESFAKDMQLVWDNSKLFNPPNNIYHRMASELETLTNRKISAAVRDVKQLEKKGNPLDSEFVSSEVAVNAATLRKANARTPSSRPAKKSKSGPKNLSYAEKAKLREDLVEISQNTPELIFEVIRDSIEKNLDGLQEYEIDIDKLPTPTLRKLQQLVRVESKKKTPSSSRRKIDDKGLMQTSQPAIATEDNASSSSDYDDELPLIGEDEIPPVSDLKSSLQTVDILQDNQISQSSDIMIENSEAWNFMD